MFGSRDLSLVAVFAAIYIGYGYVSSIFFRQFTRSLDLFFLIAILFSILAVMVQTIGAATLFGIITGIIFFGTPAPAAQHIAASLVANGAVFDVYLRLMRRNNEPTRTNVVVGASLGNLAMAIVGLITLQASGINIPAILWPTAVVGDTIVGAAGALLGFNIALRIRTGTQIRTRKLY